MEAIVSAGIMEATGNAPVVGSAQEAIIKGVQSSYKEGNHPLRAVAGVETPTAAAAKAFVEACVGATFDAAGNKIPADARETGLINRGNAVVNKLSGIINGENIGVLANDPDVQGWVESIILQNLEQTTQYNALSVADRKLYRMSLLSDTKTIEKASELFAQRTGTDRIITDKSEQYSKEAESLTKEHDELKKSRDRIEKKLEALQEEAKEYTNYKSGAALKTGQFVTALGDLEKEAAPLRADAQVLTKQITELDARISAAEASLREITNDTSGAPITTISARRKLIIDDLAGLKAEQDNKRTELGPKQKTLAEKEANIKAISDRKAEITTQLDSLNKEYQKVKKQLGEVNPKLATALNNLHQERLKRTIAEGKTINSLERILAEAVAEAYNERMDALVKADVGVQTKKAEVAKTKLEADIRKGIANAYRNAQGEINWDLIRDHAWPIFIHGGVDGVLEGGGTLPRLIPVGMTIDEFKTDNKDLYVALSIDIKKKMGILRVAMPRKTAFMTFFRGQEPFTRQEQIDIIDQLGEGYLQDLVKNNSSVREALKSLGEEGMVKGTQRISENLKKRSIGSLFMLLPLLLSGGFLFGKGRQ